MDSTHFNKVVYPDALSMAQRAAQDIAECAARAIAEHGRFNLFLGGGSTPRYLHKELVTEPLRSQIDWDKVYLFCGDERFLPVGDPEKNETMFRETLSGPLNFPEERLFNMPYLLPAEHAAEVYEKTLREHLVGPVDLMLLGMGPDGHCLSLFPGSPALQEQHKWVVSGPGLNPPAGTRITVTLPFLDQVSEGWFLIVGADKKPKLSAIFSGDMSFPSAVVAQRLKKCNWLLDETCNP